ncbi:polyprenyl synthetase family protein [Kitasatospora acidiphila]|uniref:polyprenyl synthetase family protein n=1 Tax=Kitasatospora acidiphila TaxID=2567942 RepID=UPI003C79687C
MALEMLHTSTLIHDDIRDEGTPRRDLPTLWKVVGVNQALLVGNLFATRALALAHTDAAQAFLGSYQRVNAAQLRESKKRGCLKTRAALEVIHPGDGARPPPPMHVQPALAGGPHPSAQCRR